MSADEILFDVDDRMEKAATVLKTNLAGIRTGRANPGLVDSLRVEVYGSTSPMKQIASIGVPEPNQIVIRPFDPNTIGDIEKSLISCELGFNPQNDGRLIRITIPALSTEVRRKMVSRIKELSEESKISLRNIRRDGNKAADQGEKDNELTEDDRDHVKDEIQKLTKKYEDIVNQAAVTREQDVMED